ncbi:D-aminoacyl-tRNA deacylase [candidate division KSB1 bacterium]
MRAVIQRAKWGRVKVDEEVVGEIGEGLVILLGVSADDSEENAKYLADKCVNLRIFNDSEGKMNLSLLDVGGEILSISQFTLYADTSRGRRPGFAYAAEPAKGKKLYEKFNQYLSDTGLTMKTGIFGAMMDVELLNDGPVTIIVDSK